MFIAAKHYTAIVLFSLTMGLSVHAETQDFSIVDNLPANTCAWVHVHDFQSWNKAFDESQFQNVLNQKVFRNFAETWHAYTISDTYALEYGLNVDEFDRIATKGFVVAWLPAGPQEMQQIAIVDTSETKGIVDELIKKAAARYVENGYKESSTDGLRVFTSKDKKQTIIGRRNNRFVVAHSMSAIDAVFKTTKPLSKEAGYQFIRKSIGALDGGPSGIRLHCYCAPWRMLQHSSSPPANLQLMIEQGFSAVDAIGGVVGFTADDIMSYRFTAHAQQPLRDAAVALNSKPVSIDLPEWLVARSRGVQVAGLDEQSLLSGYGKWFDATEGEGEVGLFDLVLDEIRDEPDAPGVDIRTELVDQVASPLYAVRPNSKTGDLPIVVAVKAQDINVVKQAIGKMFAGDPDVRKINVGGATAWQFGDLTAGGTQQVLGPDLSQVTICVYREHVLASAKAESIAVLVSENADKKSAASEAMNAIRPFAASIAKDAPSQTLVGYRFAQGADWFAQGYDRLRSAEVIEDSADTTFLLGNITVTLFNRLVAGPAQNAFPKLPPLDVAVKHVGIAMDLLHTSNQDGWTVTGVIRPPAP